MKFYHFHHPTPNTPNAKYLHRVYAHGKAEAWLGTDLLAYTGAELDGCPDGETPTPVTLGNLLGEEKPALLYIWSAKGTPSRRGSHPDETEQTRNRIGFVVFASDTQACAVAASKAAEQPAVV